MKPCPWCGRTAVRSVIHYGTESPVWQVECSAQTRVPCPGREVCWARPHVRGNTKEVADERWNSWGAK